MNMKYLFPLLVLILLILFLYSFLESSLEEDRYLEETEARRNEIIDFMVNDPKSPFKQKGDITYQGLKFFDIDPAFRVKAKIERLTSPVPVKLQMTDGEPGDFFEYAIAHFTLQDTRQRLVLLKSKDFYDDPWLFLPFYDETSALETYGGGRFLNVEYHGEKEIYIDFNLAYNPYCAYTDAYSCPIPPSANRISVKVTAGERNYGSHH